MRRPAPAPTHHFHRVAVDAHHLHGGYIRCDHCQTIVNQDHEALVWIRSTRRSRWYACSEAHAVKLADRLDRAPFEIVGSAR